VVFTRTKSQTIKKSHTPPQRRRVRCSRPLYSSHTTQPPPHHTPPKPATCDDDRWFTRNMLSQTPNSVPTPSINDGLFCSAVTIMSSPLRTSDVRVTASTPTYVADTRLASQPQAHTQATARCD
jgi:hypothetical protein